MVEFLKKLTAIMFYASLPLLLPLSYSLYIGDGAAFSIASVILLLGFVALPEVVEHLLHHIRGFLDSLLYQETPWNYAEIIHFKQLGERVETMTLGEILALTSVAWLVIPAVAALPYAVHGMGVVDALFESLSGWTSTGLSVLPTVEILPPSLLLYRSITHWVGGLGIVILMLTVWRSREAAKFLRAEGREPSEIGIGRTVGSIWKVYLVLSAVSIIGLLALNFGFFNAINLAMSGISSGGFFPFDSYDFTDVQKVALAVVMFMGATSFLFYQRMSKGQVQRAFRDEELLLYVLVTVLAFLLIVGIGKEGPFNTFLNAVSAITSGGFVIGDLAILHDFARYLLILLMLSGGMIGSTAGGIKLWRILLVLKSIVRHVRAAFLPKGTVQVVKINGKAVDEEAIVESSIFIFSYVTLFLFAAGIFIAYNYAIVDALFLVASAMGNVGLSTLSLYGVGDAAKVFLMVLMYLGRIEIFPSLALLRFLAGLVKK